MLAGCASVGPDYKSPEPQAAQAWHAEAATDVADEAALGQWWESFGDRAMSGLIGRAMDANLDLRSAISRLRESRARLGMSNAGFYPTLDASASAVRSRSSSAIGGGGISNSYSLSMDAAWELDIFGGSRRASEAARADMEATMESMRGVRVSLAAEVALNYISLRAYQLRMASAESNLAALEDEARTVRARREAGLASELELVEAEGAVHEARSGLPSLRSGSDEAQNRLCVLLGLRPGALDAELAEGAPLPSAEYELSAGLPADLIRRRPDVRQAERKLAAETARIGVAVAELYPKFTLGGTIGYRASATGDLMSSGSDTYSFGPSISVPLFRGGYLRRSIEAQGEVREQAQLAYEDAVLGALEEAENALSSYRLAVEEAASRRLALDAASRSERITRALYESGLRDYKTYLDMNMKRISMEDAMIASEAEVASKLVGLYKALGGGWDLDQSLKETADGK